MNERDIEIEAKRIADGLLPDAIGTQAHKDLMDAFISGVAWHESQLKVTKTYYETYAPVKGVRTQNHAMPESGKFVLTNALFEAGISSKGGFSKKQIGALGDSMDKKGWRTRIIGKTISKEQYQQFLNLRK